MRKNNDHLSRAVAETIIAGFNRHYFMFRAYSAKAKGLFEIGDWRGMQALVTNRMRMYDDRVQEAVNALRRDFSSTLLNERVWQEAKSHYIALLVNHKRPELAETFFNSVSTKILDKRYYKNQFIFVRPAISTEYIESESGAFRPYYPQNAGIGKSIKEMLLSFDWKLPFADVNRDAINILRAAKKHFGDDWPPSELNLHLQALRSPFYRNKCAYIFGKIVNGHNAHPFALPVVHKDRGSLAVDAALFDAKQISVLFSFARAYFLVDMEVPSAYINFLQSIMPTRTKGDLYNMVGLGKQTKNIFWREFITHLSYSKDKFIAAPGVEGLVMLVFTLPSFPYVFKAIKDTFGPNKEFGPQYVRDKYQLVKRHDKVGRMADTLEFSNVAIPLDRFDEKLLRQIKTLLSGQIEFDDGLLILKHIYIERRLKPLNIYLKNAAPKLRQAAIVDYGYALKELASANIFPGDMLFKNFGVTRYGRIIFYDYDEIEYMTDCNFRDIPEPPYPEYELSGEPWYPVNKGDVFPEEFGSFLLGEPDVRDVFLKHHADLLTAAYWNKLKENILRGVIVDFYPYPQSCRFLTDKRLEGGDGKEAASDKSLDA